ncbi:hypothetical protein B0T26DRAFT_672318 [Lasiosphaeria miniovina]|uniref:Uncharacterized protein n=1 Tax=Lasiosphaeria miniovina TaxID=1954250 RepID=A0AA40B4Q2_9PEZI|nr:uncharacterized protein B0T26DRAFT_672318 [Lasiosphaeria miniovina]KAK0727679.1 hypothetical protein B0T26DRAFT_672318 [Lasiosphaeria miniovina]
MEHMWTLSIEMGWFDPNSDQTREDALLLEKQRMRLDRLKATGMGMKGTNPNSAKHELSQRGPSQIVSYSSRFMNKISEVTDDMNVSGSLSIKYGTIGGSGKGSFIDSDKFKESDSIDDCLGCTLRRHRLGDIFLDVFL